MSFRSLPNLSSVQTDPCLEPWTWQPATPIPEYVRGKHSKKARTDWINSPDTHHCVYNAFEGLNENLRITKDTAASEGNPPYKLWAFVGDYDAVLKPAELPSALERIGEFKPNWHETTLSGYARFIWLFEQPITLVSRAYAVHFLRFIQQKINFGTFAIGFDKPAFEDPARYYTSGCQWAKISDRTIGKDLLNGWLIEAGQSFLWSEYKDLGTIIPLPDVEAALAEKFPNFRSSWTAPFELGSAGPTFWVSGSSSPKSAILRDTGFQTFAAHAAKPFYSWDELLGAQFVSTYKAKAVGKAVEDIYHDGRLYYRKIGSNDWRGFTKDDVREHLAVSRAVSARKSKSEPSDVDRAIQHIQDFNDIDGAAPFVFKKSGAIYVSGKRVLNTHTRRVLQPAEDTATWGASGNFPWVSNFLDGFFDPTDQLPYFLAWLQRFYRSAYELDLQSGQNVFIAGQQSKGKTFLSTAVIGKLMGGTVDASKYLMAEDQFGSELFECALWSIDDATMSADRTMHRKFSEAIKKMAADKVFRYHAKFRIPTMVNWQGRVIVTCNNDAVSMRIIPDLEISILDKLQLFNASSHSNPNFGDQRTNHQVLDRELPFFARWLLDWQPPAETLSENPRYGVRSYHAANLVKSASLSSTTSGFLEILEDFKDSYFDLNPKKDCWRGTAYQLRKTLESAGGGAVLAPYNLEVIQQMLGKLATKNGSVSYEEQEDIRVWTICRTKPGKILTAPAIPEQKQVSQFSK